MYDFFSISEKLVSNKNLHELIISPHYFFIFGSMFGYDLLPSYFKIKNDVVDREIRLKPANYCPLDRIGMEICFYYAMGNIQRIDRQYLKNILAKKFQNKKCDEKINFKKIYISSTKNKCGKDVEQITIRDGREIIQKKENWIIEVKRINK